MRHLVTIREIQGLNDIKDADNIEVATLKNLGWQVVVKKNTFKPNDKVVYFEIDSAIPTTDTRFEFLRKTSYRCWKNNDTILKDCFKIKTIKMRGIFSQGLIMPLSDFPEITTNIEGTDVTELLHIEHFDTLNEMFDISVKSGNIKGTFPSFIRKTDQERIQQHPDYFEKYKDVMFTAETKFDGSSCTVYFVDKKYSESQFGVCSHNNELKNDNFSIFWKTINSLNIEENLKNYFNKTNRSLAIQGELVGPKVNGNRDNYSEFHFAVFDIFDVDKQIYLDENERHSIINEINNSGNGKLEQVHTLKTNWYVFKELDTLDKMLNYVNQKTKRGNKLEGVVFKSINHTPYFSFKCINNNYLLNDK